MAFPLTMPAAPFIRGSRFTLSSNDLVSASPLTRQVQVTELQGARWQAEYTLPPMGRPLAAAWQAFLVGLRGRVGTFYGFDPDAREPMGTAGGAPLVKGAAQTGRALITDGWPISQPAVLRAGDYFQVGVELKMVTEDIVSDALGVATLVFEPALRAAPVDNGNIVTSNPRGIFRLADQDVSWDADELSIYGISFAALEDF